MPAEAHHELGDGTVQRDVERDSGRHGIAIAIGDRHCDVDKAIEVCAARERELEPILCPVRLPARTPRADQLRLGQGPAGAVRQAAATADLERDGSSEQFLLATPDLARETGRGIQGE